MPHELNSPKRLLHGMTVASSCGNVLLLIEPLARKAHLFALHLHISVQVPKTSTAAPPVIAATADLQEQLQQYHAVLWL
jgi:hypothetical protein